MIDITRISKELEVSRAKVYSYVDFLEKTFIIRMIPKYSKSLDRSIAGGKKVYFSDTGMLNMIGNVNDSQLFENAVVNQIANYGDISFCNKKNISEIDIILDKKIAFEVKLNGIDRDYEKVKKLGEALGLENAYIISKKFKKEAGFLSPITL
jgi:hypothetical protein